MTMPVGNIVLVWNEEKKIMEKVPLKKWCEDNGIPYEITEDD